MNAKLRSGCLVNDLESGILTTRLPHGVPRSQNHYPRHLSNYRGPFCRRLQFAWHVSEPSVPGGSLAGAVTRHGTAGMT